MHKAASRKPRPGPPGPKRGPDKRKSNQNKERAERRARRAASRYLIELTAFGLFALIGTALFMGLPLFRVQPIAVTWEELSVAKYVRMENEELLKLPDTTIKLTKRPVALRGFIILLGGDEPTAHFVLSAKPPACSKCYVPDSQQVEVFSSEPIRYSSDRIVISGRLSRTQASNAGMAYQLRDARVMEK